jgi:hypothetical protein
MGVDPDRIIDGIYEAAVVPELWRRVLDDLARVGNAEGALFYAAQPGVPKWISSERIEPDIAAWASSDWLLKQKDTRAARLIPIIEPRFLTDLHAFDLEELEREPFYTEFLRSRGFG